MSSLGRVLIIDDEPLVLEIFEQTLITYGFDVCSAPTAREALSLLERHFFDVAVCDVMLEGLDGFELLDRAKRSNSNIEFVLITGAPSKRGFETALKKGAHYLTKPIDIHQLVETVSGCLNNNSTRVGSA